MDKKADTSYIELLYRRAKVKKRFSKYVPTSVTTNLVTVGVGSSVAQNLPEGSPTVLGQRLASRLASLLEGVLLYFSLLSKKYVFTQLVSKHVFTQFFGVDPKIVFRTGSRNGV